MTWIVPQIFHAEKITDDYGYQLGFVTSLLDVLLDESTNTSFRNMRGHGIFTKGKEPVYILGDDKPWIPKVYTYRVNRDNYEEIYTPGYSLGNNSGVQFCVSRTLAGTFYAVFLLENHHQSETSCILNLNDRQIVKDIREMDALYMGQFKKYEDIPEDQRFYYANRGNKTIKHTRISEDLYDELKAEAKNHDGKLEGIKELCAKQLLLDITGRE